ncbi:hypothetical protein H072_1852 [Dactylellina haptotyla CBS 200.50]|uniref:feruloyl esterase n=1 Tax=Dactylellina haptotyla (strain CBS 200.50) TaxID=1284197 RepID=S8AMK7_DACHA|nr:hypothetical protein H072_1852 [Dactylellina haptotyla CBS 200.50]
MVRLLTFLLVSAVSFLPCLAQGSAGCGKDVAATSNRQFNITSSNTGRGFLLHLPDGYDTNKQYPVIFGFHGSGSVGIYFEVDTKFSAPEWAGNDTIMVYPDALNGTWATGLPGSTPLEEDLIFVGDLLNYIRETYCVDNERVYATGISNGGGFVNRIACSTTIGRNFAAFAPDSGAYTGFEKDSKGNSTCTPYKIPIPIISFHGGNDSTVPYDGRNTSLNGTPIIATPPIEYWLQGWVDRNNCTNMTETTNGTVHHFTWTCAGIDAAMEHYKVDNMGHVWPSTEPNFSQTQDGKGVAPIEADALILGFFDRFQVNTTGTSTGNPPSSTESGAPSGTESNAPSQTTAGGGGNAAGRVEASILGMGLAVMLVVLSGFKLIVI